MAFDTNLMLRSTTDALSSTETGATVDFGGADQRDLTYCMVVPGAVSGTAPTLDVKIQESTDGTTWVDLVVFPQTAVVGKFFRTARGSLRYRRYYAAKDAYASGWGAVKIGVDLAGRMTKF
jgi:hypothetical protein